MARVVIIQLRGTRCCFSVCSLFSVSQVFCFKHGRGLVILGHAFLLPSEEGGLKGRNHSFLSGGETYRILSLGSRSRSKSGGCLSRVSLSLPGVKELLPQSGGHAVKEGRLLSLCMDLRSHSTSPALWQTPQRSENALKPLMTSGPELGRMS